MREQRRRRPTGNRAGRYSPLSAGLLALALALFVLPSSLNLPRTDPTQTLEFAPVPPTDDEPPPQESGDLGALSLGTSSGPAASVPAAGGLDGPTPPRTPDVPGVPPPRGTGARPSSKDCVGNPPRQTEDPLSPPCVAYFDGDNGGSTAAGVEADQIRVLVYFDGDGTIPPPQGYPANEYYDLTKPPREEGEPNRVTDFRRFAKHFNHRYQTYNRRVDFWIHFGSPERSPETRIADALDGIAKVKPFAVVSYAATFSDTYIETMADHGVVTLVGSGSVTSAIGLSSEFFRAYPGLIYGYRPTVEMQADLFVSFLCTKVVGHPVSFSDNDDHGSPRVLGIIRSRDEQAWGPYALFGRLVKQGVEECGGEFASDQPLANPQCGGSVCNPSDPQEATTQLSEMRLAEVTTIVWAGGFHTAYSNSAAQLQPRWRPEWVLGGSDEDPFWAAREDQDVWQHARMLSLWPRVGDIEDAPCYEAIVTNTDPEYPKTEIPFMCTRYNDVRMLYTAIQVAGPKLTAASVDRGLHAIPPVPSRDPTVPACFFNTDDYTCVKDAQMQWWDPLGKMNEGTQAGCWRSMLAARRFLAGRWPNGDIERHRRPAADRCNTQGSYA